MRKIVLAISVAASLSACSWLTPYKLEVQQGNYITEDMVAKLKPDMTRSQVRFVLGTPLITDVFHADRWDYIYRVYKDGKVLEDKKFSVLFDGDKAVKYEGSVMPPLKGFVTEATKLSPRDETMEQSRERDDRRIQDEAKREAKDTSQ